MLSLDRFNYPCLSGDMFLLLPCWGRVYRNDTAMNIFDFITQDEIEDLPEDPAMAFLEFVRIAQQRLSERTGELDARSEEDWYLLEEARYGFQNVVVAAGKRFGIEPFASLSMPRFDAYNKNKDDYKQFRADLDHYTTQILLDTSIRGRRDSVFIDPNVKDRIRSYLHGLRTAVGQSNFGSSKREMLLKKLEEFERALDKDRLNLVAVTRLVISILAVPGSLWGSYEVVTKLTTNILQVVGEAKSADDERRQLPPADKPAALSPPRIESESKDEFDDEIPF